jgi:hypothetical protein
VLDESFGVDGLHVSSGIEVWTDDRPQLVRVATGYRVAGDVRTGNRSNCHVVALTAEGAVDPTFGVNGVATTPDPAQESGHCSGIARDDDDNLLVASRNSSRGIVTRLTPAGYIDPTLAMADTTALLSDVTAVASGRGGSIMIAGHDRNGLSGMVVARLLADGHLDMLFGRNGTSSVDLDLDFDFATSTTINKMLVVEDGGVVLAGGYAGGTQPFAAKLLGDAGGDSPGVLAFSNVYTDAAEQDGQALVTVRRVGGSSGAVSVAVATSEEEGYPPATPGDDFTMVQTTLHWDDGDVSDRQFAVPLAADGGTERAEAFFVRLSDVEGGAGLGTRRSVVQIRGDGYPGGLFTIEPIWLAVAEGADDDQFVVYRNDYWGGRVSVTVTPIGGTATPDSDFVASPITLTWEDGDTTPKYLSFKTRDDDLDESDETLVVALSAASGGAIVGDPAESQITLRDPIKLDPPADGGGGRFDVLLAALLGLRAALRGRRSDRIS